MAESRTMSGTITSDDVLGKDVMDTEGDFIGIVEKLHLTSKVEIVGITVDRGFMKRELVIGKGYIDRVTPYAVLLNIRPMLLLRGMNVFDSEGSKLGVVSDIVLTGNGNDMETLIVRRVPGGKISIPAGAIDSIADGIFLRRRKDDLILSKDKDA